MRLKKTLLALLVYPALLVGSASAQNNAPTIDTVGELDLRSDVITPGLVSRYFGMNVSGSGDVVIRVIAGESSSDSSETLRLASTQFTSFFFSNDLSNLGPVFRRGARGSVTVQLISNGSVTDSVDVPFDRLLPRRNCVQDQPSRVPCRQAEISKLSKRQRTKFVTAFARSIRGPIFLEP